MSTTLNEAVAITKTFTSKPSNEELLKLYGIYKQATEGDNKAERPKGFDFKAGAKYNSWMKYVGKTKEEASREYIKLVDELSKEYRKNSNGELWTLKPCPRWDHFGNLFFLTSVISSELGRNETPNYQLLNMINHHRKED